MLLRCFYLCFFTFKISFIKKSKTVSIASITILLVEFNQNQMALCSHTPIALWELGIATRQCKIIEKV